MRRQRAPRSEEATNERIEAFKAALKRASEERAEALAAKESAENECQRQFTRLTQEIERNENRIHELLRQNVEMELKYVRGDGAFDAVVERIKEGMREDIRTRRDVHGIIDRRACTDPSVLQGHDDVEAWLAARPNVLVRLMNACTVDLIPHEDVDKEEFKRKHQLFVTVAIAAMYKSAHDHAHFALGYVASMFVYAKTGSKTAVTALSKMFPGARATRTVNRLWRSIIEKTKHFVSACPPRANVIFGHDNVAKGNYKGARTSRWTSASHVISIVTNRCVAILKTPTGREQDLRFVQNDRECSPELWRNLADTPSDIMTVRTDVEPGESNSEADLLRRHVDALVRWNLKWYRKRRFTDVNANASREGEEAGGARGGEGGASTSVEPRRQPSEIKKWCPRCRKEYDLREKMCTVCFRQPLVSVGEAKKRARWLGDPIETKFTERSRTRATSEQASIVAETLQAQEFETEGFQGDDFHMLWREDVAIGSHADKHSSFTLLPVENLNPGITENKRALIDIALKEARVLGHSEEFHRRWVFVLTDLGAATRDVNLPKEVHPLAPLGHEEAMYIRVASKIVVALLEPEFLGIIPTYKSHRGVEMLADAADLHKCMQLLRTLNRVFTAAFARECATCLQLDSIEDLGRDQFIRWLREDTLDSKFTFFRDFFVLETLPTLLAFRSGLRYNNARMISAARKLLCPFIAARGAIHYYKFIITDTIRTEFQCHPTVRAIIEYFRTYKGQSWDYKLEEGNALVKSYLHDDTADGWRIASYFARFGGDLFDSFSKTLGMHKETGSFSRREPTTDDIETAMLTFIEERRCLRRAQSGTSRDPETLLGDKLYESFESLKSTGDDAVKAYVGKLKEFSSSRVTRDVKVANPMKPLNSNEKHKRTADDRIRAKVQGMTPDEIDRAYELLHEGDDDDNAFIEAVEADVARR
jgi:hypothetical protein